MRVDVVELSGASGHGRAAPTAVVVTMTLAAALTAAARAPKRLLLDSLGEGHFASSSFD